MGGSLGEQEPYNKVDNLECGQRGVSDQQHS